MWIESNRANIEDITDAEFQEEVQQALDDDNFLQDFVDEEEREHCLCPRDPNLAWLLSMVDRPHDIFENVPVGMDIHEKSC